MLAKRRLLLAVPPAPPPPSRSKVTPAMGVMIKKAQQDNNKTSLKDLERLIQQNFSAHNCPSRFSIARYLDLHGYQTVTPILKPLLSPRNIFRRIVFANQHHEKDDEFFKRIIWSDETSVSAYPKKCRYTIRVHNTLLADGRISVPSLQGGGFTVMFWGAFTAAGPGPLVPITGNITAASYIELVREHLLPMIQNTDKNFIFMQDNAPVHTARSVKNFMFENNISLLEWPAQSPDLNPIENLWGAMKSRIRKDKTFPRNRAELITRFQQAWTEMAAAEFHNLAMSVPKRLKEVKRRKGNWIMY
jgi:hypothetical protein